VQLLVGHPTLVRLGALRVQVGLGALAAGLLLGHAGALLGPFGIRFVVASEGDLPAPVVSALGAQLDLDEVPTDGLTIFRNAHALPPAAVSIDPETAAAAASASVDASEQLRDVTARPIGTVPGGWDAAVPTDGTVLLSTERLPGFRATDDGGSSLPVETSFGWATRVDAGPAAGSVRVRYTDQWMRTAAVWVLAALWAAALWITRKPGSAR
jgi:hypothetical protein